MRRRYVGCYGSLLAVFLILGGCTAGYFRSTQREPEIPIKKLFQNQQEVLPPGWTFSGIDASDIQTNTDFSFARWAVGVNYYREFGLVSISEEVHVFWNSFAARVILSPSPSSVYAGEGYIPAGWTYRPPHADRFEFGCNGGDGVAKPEGCSLILRYAEYTIVIGTPIADYMTLDDLQRLLEVIDREMTDFLQHSTLRPGPRRVPRSLDE